jgi:hypothetical protein
MEDWAHRVSEAIDIMGNPQVPEDNEGQTIEPSRGWVRFQLTSPFSTKLADAVVLDAGSSPLSPGESIQVYDANNSYSAATGNEKGYAQPLAFTDGALRNEIINIPGFGGGGGGEGDVFLSNFFFLTETAYDENLHAPIYIYEDGDDLYVYLVWEDVYDWWYATIYDEIYTSIYEDNVVTVVIQKGDAGQDAGDPVESHTGRYFDAQVGGTDVWALVQDDKRIGRLQLAALSEHTGFFAGTTYDPGSDEREVFLIDPQFTGTTVGKVYNDVLTAADWSTSPVTFGTGQVQAKKVDESGDIVAWATIDVENVQEREVPEGTIVTCIDFEGRWIVDSTASTITTHYAVVTSTAAVATYSGTHTGGDFKFCPGTAGKCVLVEKEIVADVWTGCWIMPDTGEESIADWEMNLHSIYDEVPLTAGRLIKVSQLEGLPIVPGPYTEPPVVWGEYVRITDYLRELGGWSASSDIALYHAADDGQVIKWGGDECPPPE